MTFAKRIEFEKAKSCLDGISLPYAVISPVPSYTPVGVDSLVMSQETISQFFQIALNVTPSGWVDYRPSLVAVPACQPPAFEEDIVGDCAIMVLGPCMADSTKIRLIAHISGDLTGVFPYLNAEMPQATYCRDAHILTYMDEYRMVSLFAHRLTIAKADELVDGWRCLESIRCLVNDAWQRRSSIEPCYEMRRKPPALEIYKRLPGTNCRACGEKTCLAFALQLWNGVVQPSLCRPVFSEEYRHLKAPLLQICSSLGSLMEAATNQSEKL